MGMNVWGATTTVFSWKMSGTAAPAVDATLATGLTAKTTDNSKSFSVESVAYNASVTDNDMKAADGKGLKMSSNALYLELTGTFKKGDVIAICGYNTWKISSSTSFKGDIAASIATGTSKSDYQVGEFTLTADASTLIFNRAEGSGTCVCAIKITRDGGDPVCPSGLTIASKDNKTAFVEGDKIELSASLAAGNGEISYQWYKDGVNIDGAILKNLTIF